jgi:hypothetical protein
MMRPTASWASKTTEKVEAKSPPKPKANASKARASIGSSKAGSRVSASQIPIEEAPQEVQEDIHEELDHNPEPAAEVEQTPALSFAGSTDNPAEAQAAIDSALDEPDAAKASEPAGNETPIPHTNGDAGAALEATPAALGEEETIR